MKVAGEVAAPPPRARVKMYAEGAGHDTPVYDRDHLKPGMKVAGPAIFAEKNATTIVEPGWGAEITARDHIVLRRVVPLRSAPASPGRPRPSPDRPARRSPGSGR